MTASPGPSHPGYAVFLRSFPFPDDEYDIVSMERWREAWKGFELGWRSREADDRDLRAELLEQAEHHDVEMAAAEARLAAARR